MKFFICLMTTIAFKIYDRSIEFFERHVETKIDIDNRNDLSNNAYSFQIEQSKTLKNFIQFKFIQDVQENIMK